MPKRDGRQRREHRRRAVGPVEERTDEAARRSKSSGGRSRPGNLFGARGALAVLAWVGAAQGATVLEPIARLTVEERYDDAELLRADGGGGQLLTKLAAQVGLAARSETAEASSWYSPDLLLHHGSGSVTIDHRAALEGRAAFTRRTEGRGRLQLWRVSDPTSLPRMGVARSVAPILYGRAELGLSRALSERWDGHLDYRFEGAKVFEAEREPGLYHAPSVGTSFAATRRLNLGAEYRLQLFAMGGDAGRAHGLLGGLEYRLTRHLRFRARAGPVLLTPGGEEGASILPRVHLELSREVAGAELGLVVGEDLVGASGFSSAVWAHYASAVISHRLGRPFTVFGAANYFRNGRAPQLGFSPFGPDAPGTAQGYSVAGGLEWRPLRALSLVGTFDRFAQVGEGADNVTRNIVAVRVEFTPW